MIVVGPLSSAFIFVTNDCPLPLLGYFFLFSWTNQSLALSPQLLFL